VLTVGFNRRDNGISSVHWPDGAGYTAYKWQLDGGGWSAETPVTNLLVLTNLAAGPHQVGVVGKNDAGTYQNDPLLGTNAVVTFSRPWTVAGQSDVTFTLIERTTNTVTMHFTGVPGTSYRLDFKTAVDGADWTKLAEVPTDPKTGAGVASDSTTAGAARFYRLAPASVP
jgi:hypothetical protein